MKEKSRLLWNNIRRKLFGYLIISISFLLIFVIVVNVIWGIGFETKIPLFALTVILALLSMLSLKKSDEMIENLRPITEDISDKYQKRPYLDIKFDQTPNPDREFVRSERKMIEYDTSKMSYSKEGHIIYLPFDKDVNVYFHVSNIGVNMAENVNFVIKLPNSIELIEPSEETIDPREVVSSYFIRDSKIPGIRFRIHELVGLLDEKAKTLNEKRESAYWSEYYLKVRVRKKGLSGGFCIAQCSGVSSRTIPLIFVCDASTSRSQSNNIFLIPE
jgi:hypothetical protein